MDYNVMTICTRAGECRFFVLQTSDLTSSVSAVYILFKKTDYTYNIVVNEVVHYYTKS